MKRLIFLLVALLVTTLLVQANAATSNQLVTPTDKLSYVIGLNMGKTFKKEAIQVNPNQVIKGLQDGMSGAKPLLNEAQQTQIIQTYQKRVLAQEQAKVKQQGVVDAAAGTAFLAKNAKKLGIVTLPSGLQYKILKPGKGTPPGAKDKVTVNYEGTLINGKVFDSSYKRGQPVTFAVNGVIPGWTEALQKMRPGATWMLYIPANLAYGDQHVGSIPANSVLIFKVNLIKVQKA